MIEMKSFTKFIATLRPRGAMDNASDYGSEDSRFESWRGRYVLSVF